MSPRLALSQLPPSATTGIGSLPHVRLEEALALTFQLDVPFAPQLPVGHSRELMIPAALEGLPGLLFDEAGACAIDLPAWTQAAQRFGAQVEQAIQSSAPDFAPSATSCRAFEPFLAEVQRRQLRFAKVQLAGPFTVREWAKTTAGKPASDFPRLDEQIFRLLLARCLAMVRAVQRTGATALFFLDEPGLVALDPANPRHLVCLDELKFLVRAIQQEGALVGLHCCGNTRWGRLLDLGLDLLSLDMRLSLDAVLDEGPAVKRFFASGSLLSLGLVPTDSSTRYDVTELVDSVEVALGATLTSRMPVTPACGLALRSVAEAERVFEELNMAQRLLRTF